MESRSACGDLTQLLASQDLCQEQDTAGRRNKQVPERQTALKCERNMLHRRIPQVLPAASSIVKTSSRCVAAFSSLRSSPPSALGLAGCGTTGEPTTVPARLAAPPQTAKLEWLEPYTPKAAALVFGVTAFTVTADGWSANISVENRSDVGWKIVDRGHEDELGFGVMLFPTGDQKDAERLNNSLSTSDKSGPPRPTGRCSRSCWSPGRHGAGRCPHRARSQVGSG